MANLINIGLSGLKATQAALSTTSNNISNADTEGYNRRVAQFGQSPGTSTPAGYFGNGVNLEGISRQYEGFLSNQLNKAKSEQSALSSELTEMTQIDNVLANEDSGLDSLMSSFFSSIQKLADTPADPAVRETVLGDARSMVAQFKSVSGYLGDMEQGVESQLNDAVGQINSYTSQIANLNKQITITQSKTGNEPSDLMDQRDLFVSKLSELTSINVVEQDGKYNISVSGGQSLVQGNDNYRMSLVDDSSDPTRKTVAIANGSGGNFEISEDRLTGGKVGGLLAFRNGGLESAQQRLGQLAVSLSGSINQQHVQGQDLGGNAGEPVFALGSPDSFAHADNTSTATVSTTFNDSVDQLRPSNYTVEFEAGTYTVTRESDGTTSSFASGGLPTDSNGASVISVDGLDIAVSGTPADGDAFLVKPFESATREMDLMISDPAKLAAAGAGNGIGDNTNAQAMADLQGAKRIGGDTSFSGAYAQLVSDVGTRTATLKVKSDAQNSVVEQVSTAQQSVSGVNLEEEAANLLKFQQMYTANAKVISTAQNMFNELIGIMR
ncbi:flagellar hook-associated protein FlgK [Larsenimonas suaedae]|uniref:Flagellar hook-associated protein 1 n=1 Tax=Larsenimonas suaedae TaxID=1851019 RepID=A0ABU1GT21_9GAMM|nr:flagellar hook-associated protein FlgK [Larsenimonas suaedae]MCM2971618.1 flagellar hook-associated protein FlgK [Larsenimonas suaedae]MDR5895170.1 flagellar hook-associated protein FlgK [Larsenimonas suaedae]